MADFQPPPTWALPILIDKTTNQPEFNPVWLKWFVDLVGVINAAGGTTPGTVTSLSVVSANGVSGTVTNPTTTPAITITLGDIVPSSVHINGGSGSVLVVKQTSNSNGGGFRTIRSDTTGFSEIYMGGDEGLYFQIDATSAYFNLSSTGILGVPGQVNIGTGSSIRLFSIGGSGTNISMEFNNTAGSSNQKRWTVDSGSTDGVLYWQLMNDAQNAGASWMVITRSGMTPTSVAFTGILDLTATGQIKFPATQNPSSNANTLDDYEEGTWTPTDASGAGLTLTVGTSQYVKVGQLVNVSGDILYPATISAAGASIGGLPFSNQSVNPWGGYLTYTTLGTPIYIGVNSGAATWNYLTFAGAQVLNSALSANYARGSATYRASA